MKHIASSTGDVRVFAGGKTIINARKDDIPNANITLCPSVIIQSRGIIDVVYYDKPFTFKNEMWGYTHKDLVTVKFLYYYLKNNIEYFRGKASETGSMPQISLPVTEDYPIPIPPISEQQKIVLILDEFSTLVESLTEGLPAEIKARQQQYEYYRDKLLSFPRKAC